MKVHNPGWKWYKTIHVPQPGLNLDTSTIDPIAAERVINLFNQATPKERILGTIWYPAYTARILEKAAEHNVPADIAIQLFALFSPQRSVQQNWLLYSHMVETGDASTLWCMGKEKEKATAIFNGDLEALKGLKVNDFSANLGGDFDKATIDTHAASATFGEKVSRVDDAAYRYCATIFRFVAFLVGLPVAFVQAIVWLVQKRLNGKRIFDSFTPILESILTLFTLSTEPRIVLP